jgi:predicted metal-dependent phosphoesterase TrpH
VLSAPELVQLALDSGLSALGVTDHDSTESVAEATAAAESTGLTVIPGVELSTDVPDGEVHVLGYFVDPANAGLQGKLTTLRDGRLRRGEKIVELLNAAGVPIPLERVMEFAGDGAVGRPHVARALVEAGHAASMNDAFDRYLVKGRPGYVERQKFTPVQAVNAILRAGGVPVLAHPLHGAEGDDPRSTVEARVAELAAAGLRGVEVYYDGYEDDVRDFLLGVAATFRLIVTGGSDFHGPGRAPLGSVPMPEDLQAGVVAALRDASSSLRS